MITTEQIQEVLFEIVDKIKKNYQYDHATQQIGFRQLPEFNSIYHLCIALKEDIKVHSEGLHFPDKLFRQKAPNESEEMYDYRRSIYQPVTQTIWKRGITNYNRVFNPQNFTIDDWGNDKGIYEDDTAKDYFSKEYPIGNSIINYYQGIVKNLKLEDPNAITALWLDLNEDDTEFSDPYGKIFGCEQVLKFEKDFTFILSEEKSPVKYYKDSKNIGFVFYLYDDANIYKIVQIGNFTDFSFEVDLYFEHDLGYVPTRKLGGVPKLVHDEVLYFSEALDSIYPLNEIAFDNSTLQASKIANAFMEKWEIVDECDYEGCRDGRIWDAEHGEDGGYINCPSCKGSGRRNVDPLGVHSIVKRAGEEVDVALPPAGFITKDTDVLEFLRSEIELNEQKSFSYLGVDVSTTTIHGTETALGKMIDREVLFSALSSFSFEIFELMEFEIDFAGKTRYGKERFVNPSVKKPNNFSIRNEDDLTEEYAEAKDKGMPDAVNVMILKQLMHTRFGTNQDLLRIIEVKQYTDRLFSMNNDEALQQKAQGCAQQWEVILHVSFDTYISQKIDEDENYLENDNSKIKDDLVTMAKADVNVPGSIDNILNIET